jgi:hypothetical protein
MSDLHTATLISDANLADTVELPARLGGTAGLLKITLLKIATYLLGSASFIEALQDMIAAFFANGTNMTLTYNDAGNLVTVNGPTLYYPYGSFAIAAINANEILLDHIVAAAHTLAADFANARVSVGTPPAATWTANVQKNGGNVGTIVIDNTGGVTLATTGHAAVVVAAGDVISVVAPASADPNIARLRFTFRGTM